MSGYVLIRLVMIIARSPLRITFGGGGTDLPSYYKEFGGFLISAAIDKYVYVTALRPFRPGIFLKYSKIEMAEGIDGIQHPIVREVLRDYPETVPQIEITTLADIPSGTGLGSSGSFTTALLKAVSTYHRESLPAETLASRACEIEIERLKEPIGKQDQYIAAYGGITCFQFNQDDSVRVAALKLSPESYHDLEDNLLLFFTGYERSASSILKDQKVRTENSEADIIGQMHEVKEMGLKSKTLLESGKLTDFADLMHHHWLLKRRRSTNITNPQIDEWYELGRKNGAVGGKLVGAGGGGFLLFYAEDRHKLRKAMSSCGLEEVRFRFDFSGTNVTVT
jgi:D-glycero-alpha-D-manno-heptose-7-phosphate kinase